MVTMLFALGGIRTPNNCSEGNCDIHFTTRAKLFCRLMVFFVNFFEAGVGDVGIDLCGGNT